MPVTFLAGVLVGFGCLLGVLYLYEQWMWEWTG